LLKLVEVESGCYSVKIPSSLFIQYPPETDESRKLLAEGKVYPKSTYSFNISINTQKPITYLSIPRYSRLVNEDKSNPCSFKIEKKEGNANQLRKDLVVLFKTVDMN
jgi:hypothetical protein